MTKLHQGNKFDVSKFVSVLGYDINIITSPQALDGNFVKILYFIKCQSVLYLSLKFQVDRPGNKEVTIYPTALSK